MLYVIAMALVQAVGPATKPVPTKVMVYILGLASVAVQDRLCPV